MTTTKHRTRPTTATGHRHVAAATVTQRLRNWRRRAVAHLRGLHTQPCAATSCTRHLIAGDTVRVVPVFSAHDPTNFGPGPPDADPIRIDRYHPQCADQLGLINDGTGRHIWLPARPGSRQ